MITEKIIETKDLVTKSNLPASDYVINPYVGCPHACKYCYACFMKRFTKHAENWGTFIDIKECKKPISKRKLEGKRIFLSSVTDCYNKYEEKYRVTRKVLEQLADIDCYISISTKSGLILRDIDILKKCKHLTVAISLNTLDEQFRSDMDNADSVTKRIHTLKSLHDEGIYTILFMSPIFPEITDYKSIIEQTKDYVNEYWFENLNIRGSYKPEILDYINEKYPHLSELYNQIYYNNNMNYWEELSAEMENYCSSNNIKYINYFYHEKLVK